MKALVILSLPVPSVGIFELSMVEDMSGAESWRGGEKMGRVPDQGNLAGGSQHVTSTPQRFVILRFFS